MYVNFRLQLYTYIYCQNIVPTFAEEHGILTQQQICFAGDDFHFGLWHSEEEEQY